MSLHYQLATAVRETFDEALVAPPELKQDALVVRLANGVELTVRYAAPNAYSLRWTHGSAEAAIDTAPLHCHLPTFPNHFHDARGGIHPDPVTRPGDAPRDNLLRLIRALLDRPLLDSGGR